MQRMNDITYKPIGVVHSPFKEPRNVPTGSSFKGH